VDPFETLAKTLRDQNKRQLPVQTFWGTCKAVNGETMTATDSDGLDYFKVLLGIGAIIQVPVVGSRVLLGILENQATGCFLIFAEATAEIRLRGAMLGGMLISDKVAARLQEHENKVNALIDYISLLPVPVSGAVSGPPVPVAYTGFKLTATESSALQNNKIQHG